MSVRFETHAEGYSLVRADGEDTQNGRRRFVAIHRLVAFAEGEIDSLSEPLEIHHEDTIPWSNGAGNLSAYTSGEHARITRQVAAERRARVDGGER